jgi:hypothetical protein
MRKFVSLSILMCLLALTLPALALASSENRHIDTSKVFSPIPKSLELKEPKLDEDEKAAVKAEAEGGAAKETAKFKEKAKKAESKEEAEGKEKEPSWKIPGWQSIFTALAVVFYGLMLTVLPKIMAKEVEHH